MRSARPGAGPRLNAIVFEKVRDGWIGSGPLHHQVTLESLSGEDVEELLLKAVGRGSAEHATGRGFWP